MVFQVAHISRQMTVEGTYSHTRCSKQSSTLCTVMERNTMFIHTQKESCMGEKMDQREILFSVTEADRLWGENGRGLPGDERWSEREELLSVRELWPQAAVPAVAKSGQKAIDYILKDAEDDDCQRTGEGEGRRESNDAVDKNIMENAQSLKETNYPIWQKSDFINMFSFHLTLFFFVVGVVSVYDHLSHFQVQSVTFNECPEIGAAGPERKGIVFFYYYYCLFVSPSLSLFSLPLWSLLFSSVGVCWQ